MKKKTIKISKEEMHLRVHRELLLREAEKFREHKKGIPEWIKNANDSYLRHEEFEGEDFTNKPILINFSKDEMMCLDFGGATGEQMIEHIPFYGSPEASTHGKKMIKRVVSGGHGNGGKYYSLAQFSECQIISYYKGKLSMLTLDAHSDYKNIINQPCSPFEALKIMGIDEWVYFEKDKIYGGKELFKKILNGEMNLFCWRGLNPKDKRPLSTSCGISNLISTISNHTQARAALRARVVNVLIDGRMRWPNLKPEQIEEDSSFGTREFSLPNKLEDYEFNKTIKSVLRIRLSTKPLIGDKSSLNILEIDANEGNIAYYDLPDLMLDKGVSKSLIAYIDCPELKEYRCVENDRVHLNPNPASNLFLAWCKSKINEIIIELSDKERKKIEKKDFEELGSFIKGITAEISELLEEEALKPVFSKSGEIISSVEAPTEKPGFGLDSKIKHKDGGKRRGGTEIQEAQSVEKKSKSILKILLSGIDDDPLNPGKKFEMIERQPLLYQRAEDVNYGIWWINTQKKYIRKIKIRDPGAVPFYFFLIKEIILSHRLRRRFKESDRYDPDSLESLNFDLIDEIFNRVVERLGINLALDENISENIRETIKTKNKFTIQELSEEICIEPMHIHAFISNPANNVLESFDVKKEKQENGRTINVYMRKL